MSLAPHTHADFEAHERRFGHPASPLPLNVREAYAAAGLSVPERRQMLSIITPPQAGRCHVCGVETAPDARRTAYAVAGFEDATHPDSGLPLRLLVTHCSEHEGSDHCKRDALTPGSGISDAPGGFCEPLSSELELGISLFPGARYLGRFLRYALGSAGILLPAWLAVQVSQGQQVADHGGPVTSLLVPGDATAGHGYNAGLLRILSGSAPASGNAAETGTLLISWTMPATAFGAPSAALPSVATANAITNVSASATGTAGYGRLVEQADSGFGLSTTLRRYQFDVGTSGASMNFNTLSISSGGTCSISSLSVTHG